MGFVLTGLGLGSMGALLGSASLGSIGFMDFFLGLVVCSLGCFVVWFGGRWMGVVMGTYLHCWGCNLFGVDGSEVGSVFFCDVCGGGVLCAQGH